MQPGRFTELFFLDEATAFAAGHRPCALCRRDDYVRFVERWRAMYPDDRSADAIDARLHGERFDPVARTQRHHDAVLGELPDGAFVLDAGSPWLVLEGQLLRWTPGGYAERADARRGRRVRAITPVSIVAVLREPWEPVVPFLHPTATGSASEPPPTR
jgi:hypothetical protein